MTHLLRMIRAASLCAALLLPLTSLAEDTPPAVSPDSAATPAPETSSAAPAATSTESGASADGLSAPGSTGALLGPASSGSSSSLQPVGTSTLQSTTGDASGLSAPVSDQLQGSAPTGDLKVLLDGEADGRQRASGADADQPGLAAQDTLALLSMLGLIGLVFALRRRVSRRFAD